MASPEEATPVVESKPIIANKRLTEPDDMSQSYHEIFDTQGYIQNKEQQDDTASDDNKVEVFYSEGEGKLVSVSPPGGSAQPMSQYLTRKLVADSLMWQQTFRNDSPSPEEPGPVPGGSGGSGVCRPDTLLVSHLDQDKAQVSGAGKISVIDTSVINDIEKDARRLATDVDAMVENLSCILQVSDDIH